MGKQVGTKFVETRVNESNASGKLGKMISARRYQVFALVSVLATNRATKAAQAKRVVVQTTRIRVKWAIAGLRGRNGPF